MSKFGWSYPAGAEGDPWAPYNQDDHDLGVYDAPLRHWFAHSELNTRRCSAFLWTEEGKDADLTPTGCSGVTEIEVGVDAEDTPIVRISLSGHKSIGDPREWGVERESVNWDAVCDVAQDIVCGDGYAGEWDGSGWTLSWEDTIEIQIPEGDDWLAEMEPPMVDAIRQCIALNARWLPCIDESMGALFADVEAGRFDR